MEYQVRNLTALGLLVVIATALFVWGFFFLLGDPIGVSGDEVVVRMEDGAGLGRGNPVHLNGVQVGTVRRVTLDPPGVTVRIKIDDDIRLSADTRAVAQADVFGTKSITLEPGQALVALEGGDTIQGLVRRPLPELATELGAKAEVLMASADSLLSPVAVRDLKATAAVLPETARQLQSAFRELTLAASAIRRTAEELEQASAGQAAAETLHELQSSARAATQTLTTLDRSLQSLESVLGKVDRGEGTLGRLVNDTALYGELEAMLREVRSLAADVRADPKKFLSVEIF